MDDPLSLADLIVNPEERKLVAIRLGAIVEDSFAKHTMRRITRSEIVRRLEIATKWFRQLRTNRTNPMRTPRALDETTHAVDAELGGREYKLPSSILWVPESLR